MLKFLRSIEEAKLTYWGGLCLLFLGLSLNSLSTALSVVGAVIAAESVVTSYLAIYFSVKG